MISRESINSMILDLSCAKQHEYIQVTGALIDSAGLITPLAAVAEVRRQVA